MRNSLPALLALTLTGCALIRQGTSQEVEFTSEPDHATFIILGKQHTTPKMLELPKDDYKIVFSKEGFEDEEFMLTRQVSGYFIWSVVGGLIAAGIDIVTGAWKEFVTTKVHAVLRPKPEVPVEVETHITSSPAGAEIAIDGAATGRKTPAWVTLKWWRADREKKVTLKLAEHKLRDVLLPSQQPSLHAELVEDPRPASVRLKTSPEAEVWLGDRKLGTAPGTIELLWRPGRNTQIVTLKREGFRELPVQVTRGQAEVDAGELVEIVPDVTVTLKLEPADAQVEADGSAVPVKDGRITLPWRSGRVSYELRVSHPGYESAVKEVRREDAAGPVEVKLRPFLPKAP